MAASRQTAVSVNADAPAGKRDSLLGAGALAGGDLAATIGSAWQKEEQPLTAVRVLIQGTRNLGNFVMFRRYLNELDGVKQMIPREMAIDEAVMIVDYQGPATALAEALMRLTFEAFGLDISAVTNDTMTVRLVPN